MVVVAHDADEEGDATARGVADGVEHLVDGQRLVAQGDERDRRRGRSAWGSSVTVRRNLPGRIVVGCIETTSSHPTRGDRRDRPPARRRRHTRACPPEIEQLLRGLTGGEVDPQLASMMQGMGLDKVDPQMLAMVMGQVQAMFSAPESDTAVNAVLATDIARKTVAAEGDELASAADGRAAGRGGAGGRHVARRRHGIASAHFICPSKPSDVAMAR